jgi:predicted Rossmann fold flavoprotein
MRGEDCSIPQAVAVVGGGAAGFFAAITCAEEYPSARVTLYEKGAQALAKVRVSGGGRCNVTHACFEPRTLIGHYPRGGRALLGPFTTFQPADTRRWFESRGVALKTESDGRMFPVSDSSQTIVTALTEAARSAGVAVRTRSGPVSVDREGPARFRLTLPGGETVFCDRLLLATGSAREGYAWARALGHTVEPPVPSLFTFTVPDERLRGLAGLSVENAELALVGTTIRQRGPLLITHVGLSGPAVLKLSAWGARALHDLDYQATLRINWAGLHTKSARENLVEYKKDHSRKLVSAHSPRILPHRLWERLTLAAGVPPGRRWADLSKEELDRLTTEVTAMTCVLRGKSTFKEEFVTCGGVRLDEVDFRTLESRLVPGLHFAGEILDIDGVTGGFNFQSAWTTGRLAGLALGRSFGARV